jgi:hypothetical protein
MSVVQILLLQLRGPKGRKKNAGKEEEERKKGKETMMNL